MPKPPHNFQANLAENRRERELLRDATPPLPLRIPGPLLGKCREWKHRIPCSIRSEKRDRVAPNHRLQDLRFARVPKWRCDGVGKKTVRAEKDSSARGKASIQKLQEGELELYSRYL